MRANFEEKQTTLIFSTQICPKINFGVRIASPDSESTLPRFHVCQFLVKTDNFDFFLAQICPKGKLGFQIQKTNIGIKISIFEIPYVPILKQNFDFLVPNLPKNVFWGRNFKNLSLDPESTPPLYYVRQF